MTLLLTYLTIAIGISFLCSVLEAVLLSVTPTFVEQIQARRPIAGARLQQVREKLDASLASILILNTFAHTMGATGVGSQALQVFGPQWETLIALLLTLAILYFSEIIPKTLGAIFWRQLAIPAAFVITWLVKAAYPLVWISTLLTQAFSKGQEHEITREEIIALASLSHKKGALLSQETEYLTNLLKLGECRVEQIFTPRSVVHMLDHKLSVSDALKDPQTRQFTRIPVYGDDPDDIRGKVIRADLYDAEREGHGKKPVGDFAKPVTRVSEKLSVRLLLEMFIRQKAHLFMVEDEFGQIAGVVTLEDAIETLLGREIMDERDAVADMQALAKSRQQERLHGK
jgi:CBS domain containing-hemolysin-like protein